MKRTMTPGILVSRGPFPSLCRSPFRLTVRITRITLPGTKTVLTFRRRHVSFPDCTVGEPRCTSDDDVHVAWSDKSRRSRSQGDQHTASQGYQVGFKSECGL